MMAGLVAITGASGFVGARIAQTLARSGWRVRLLARRMPQAALMPEYRIEVVLGDLDDIPSLERLVAGSEAIVHSAGLVRALSPADFFAANETGTENLLLAAARAAPAARLVHISSLAARAPDLSPYAASKRAAESKVAALAGARDWIALRPPAVYGPGDLELLPLFKAAKLGLVAYPAAPQARVSLLHVADLAAAVVALLATPNWQAQLVAMDDGRVGGHTWSDILTALGTAFGRRPLACRLPRSILLPIAGGASLIARLRNRPQVLAWHKVPELYHPDWAIDGPALPGMVNWVPRFDLAGGFAETAAWYRMQSLL